MIFNKMASSRDSNLIPLLPGMLSCVGLPHSKILSTTTVNARVIDDEDDATSPPPRIDTTPSSSTPPNLNDDPAASPTPHGDE